MSFNSFTSVRQALADAVSARGGVWLTTHATVVRHLSEVLASSGVKPGALRYFTLGLSSHTSLASTGYVGGTNKVILLYDRNVFTADSATDHVEKCAEDRGLPQEVQVEMFDIGVELMVPMSDDQDRQAVIV